MSSCIAAALLALLAFAPQAKEPPAIATARQDPRFHALVEKQFLAYEGSLTTRCKDIQPDWRRATLDLYGAVELDKDGYPYKATWAEQVAGTACGEPRRFRALVVIREGRLETQRLLPGDSDTSAQLEADVRDPLLAAAQGFARDIKPSCAVDVLDTRILDKSVRPAPWQETWLVSICGHRLNIPITFIPDATGPGASYSIKSDKITAAR